MRYCINPNCPHPQNPGDLRTCQACTSELLLNRGFWVTRPPVAERFSDGQLVSKIFEITDGNTAKILKVLYDTDSKAVELLERERDVLIKLTGKNCLGVPKVDPDLSKVLFSIQLPNTSGLVKCLVMEKIEGMNLQEWMASRNNSPLTEQEAIDWLTQLVEILAQLHAFNFFHRDIKPPNIMRRDNGQLVLIDFGTVREVTNTIIRGKDVTLVLSHGYTPSEQQERHPVPQSDFFSLGRTFVYLLTGKHPTELRKNSQTGGLIWRKYAPQVSKDLADLIDDLMAPFPYQRPKNVRVILQRLQLIKYRLLLQKFIDRLKPTSLRQPLQWIAPLAFLALIIFASRQPLVDSCRKGINGEFDQYGLSKRVIQTFKQQDVELVNLVETKTIKVSQWGCTVRLEGTVPSQAVLDKLVNIAKQVEGTKEVDTKQITLCPIIEQVMTAFQQNPEVTIALNTITVDQQSCKVIELKGRVSSQEILKRLEAIAQGVSGVEKVDTTGVTVE